MDDLILAMKAQTEAISALAASNMALVDAITQALHGEDGEPIERERYLDGSPRG